MYTNLWKVQFRPIRGNFSFRKMEYVQKGVVSNDSWLPALVQLFNLLWYPTNVENMSRFQIDLNQVPDLKKDQNWFSSSGFFSGNKKPQSGPEYRKAFQLGENCGRSSDCKTSYRTNLSDAVRSECLNRKRPKCKFWELTFFRAIKHLRVIRNTKWHHDCMKTVGGVVIAKLLTDRTEIEGKIDEFLSAKWSTWNTLKKFSD